MSPVPIATIITVAIVLFVWNTLPAVVVAILVCMSLWTSGILSFNQTFAGFDDPAVLFIIVTLFMVSSALEVLSGTAWARQRLVQGQRRRGRASAGRRHCGASQAKVYQQHRNDSDRVSDQRHSSGHHGHFTRPVLMSTTVAVQAAPIATPKNVMTMGPDGYTFSEYGKPRRKLLACPADLVVRDRLWRGDGKFLNAGRQVDDRMEECNDDGSRK
ncbi:MAG TPA: hypothetical protein VL202_12285 [Pararhizobium sp.]|uniref:hypothetical protein n=1 Tax=Pararhizobium sp. TaxID=1977563 RepID=UPI002C3979EC|nr:hypothetical protein [Pararhizobium sp.]HTO31940.1 hypothetical protein [Pararhizobium sp.]